jgi:uncharacterized beta-barrel protein YwiB (DUF1934 family)
MKKRVMLSICGAQAYQDQEPDKIELLTEGTMEFRDGGWDISYRESDLTGLAGVTTVFRVEPEKLTLTRSGKLTSRMVFQQGVPHESLYQMDFGALLMRVCAKQIYFDVTPEGGFVDLVYTIEIENSAAGQVDYHLDIRAME